MNEIKRNPEREARITLDIIVDRYDDTERAMGWYYYLQDKLQFPFTAECVAQRAISPLHRNETVEVIEMAPEEECEHEMFVLIRRRQGDRAVPLAQLMPVAADEETVQAVEDWRYWVQQGYQC
ncbi:calcium-binding protein [Methylocaldum sp.]|uniref:calcium-binding protein n=1 Tax=Methylocaldum sp. TaxID=1969727 RepID=UPI002D3972C1|nr:calcium-binding protein [Methylocaldum sp.]HYE34669.1 calcium-binding protein [Methylocaldum sp.]